MNLLQSTTERSVLLNKAQNINFGVKQNVLFYSFRLKILITEENRKFCFPHLGSLIYYKVKQNVLFYFKGSNN
jgi:hypothetical protein